MEKSSSCDFNLTSAVIDFPYLGWAYFKVAAYEEFIDESDILYCN